MHRYQKSAGLQSRARPPLNFRTNESPAANHLHGVALNNAPRESLPVSSQKLVAEGQKVKLDAGPASRGVREVNTANVGAAAGLITVKKAAELTGLSEKAIRRKREDGVWREGREIIVSPDNRIFIDLQAVEKWVRGMQ